MPASHDDVVPPDAAAVAARYRRLERPASAGLAVFVGLVAGAALLALPLTPGVVVAVAVLLAVRLPVFRSRGTATLTTAADPDAVRADFTGACPPPLAFQWGVADGIERTDEGWAYDFSYLLGLRSVRMTVAMAETEEGLELRVGAGGRSWATYEVAIHEEDGETTVTVDWRSERRFGLRRLPQWLLAERYRRAALEAQGYRVVERDAGLSL